jgi:DNA-binding transcriptional LysR family regulator
VRLPDNIDVQTLNCLQVLIEERSVSKAAERMGLSQPTVSRILGQLRKLANDPLLVRTARGMEPTQRGLLLAAGVRTQLAGLEALFGDAEFDPATATGEIVLSTTEGRGAVLLPRLVNRLHAFAPKVRVTLRQFDYQRIYEWLEAGTCDIGVGHLIEPPSGVFQMEVERDRQCCIVAQSHPVLRHRLSLEDYVAARHVVFGQPHTTVASGEESIDQALSGMGMRREVLLNIPSPLMAGELVAATDLVATVSERLARYCASRWPVRVFPLPFEAPALRISLVWHERTHRNPLCKWLRQEIPDILAGEAVEEQVVKK